MHPITEVGTNVSAFLAKLWRMVEDPETSDLISWNSDGTSFVIKNQSQFAKELLPMYYKHNNMASFIRQLNMYGFHKVVSAESNGLRMSDNDEISFSHHCFIRGHPYLLEHIKRKMTVTKDNSEVRATPDVMNKVLNDVKLMKSRQESLDSKLATTKQENETLWRELSILRQKHAKQQQIVNKLIQFLVTLVHPTRNLTVKRRSNFPLMLKEKAHNFNNSRRKPAYESKKRAYSGSSDSTSSSPSGPTIHELDPSDFLENVQILENETSAATQQSDMPLSPTISDCDSGDQELTIASPDAITSKIRNKLDDGTLLDLVTEAVSPVEELIAVPPEDVSLDLNKVGKNSGSSNISKRVNRPHQPDKRVKVEQYVDLKQAKRRGGRTAKVASNASVKKTVGRMKLKTLPAVTSRKSGLKTKLPVTQITSSELSSGKESINDVNMIDTTSVSMEPNQGVTITALQPDDILYINSNQSDEKLLSPIPPTPADRNAASPVGIVTLPSPSGEIQQIFDTSPINESIMGFTDSDLFRLSENSAIVSKEPIDQQPVISVSPDEMLNQVSSSSTQPTVNDMALALASPSQISISGNDSNSINRYELDTHVDLIQNDLDCLRDLMKNEGLSLDANVLLGIFNNDDSFNMMPGYQNMNVSESNDMNQSFNQITYNPGSLDLNDVLQNADWNVPATVEQKDETDELFKDLNTPILSITSSPANSPLPLPASAKKRKK